MRPITRFRILATLLFAVPVALAVSREARPLLYNSGVGHLIESREGVHVWWAESPYKIGRNCKPPAMPKPLELAAAKGEYEPFQLIVTPSPGNDIYNLQLRTSDLRAEGGAAIPADALELRRVAYVRVSHPTDGIGHVGDWPDPLPPLDAPSELTNAPFAPFWITVHVSRDTAPGVYKGTISLTGKKLPAAYDWSCTVPLTVRVWDFEIPRENHLRTAFGFSPELLRRYHNLNTDDDYRKVLDLYYNNFAEHRISPYDFAPLDPIKVEFPTSPDQPVKIDFSRFDSRAEKYLGPEYNFSTFLLPLQGMGGGTFHSRHPGRIRDWEQGSPEYEKVFADYLNQIESHLREKGWLGKAYTYWFDEPDPKDYDFVRDGMERIHRAAPGLRRMLTEQPEEKLKDVVEIWCPLTPAVSPEIAAREKAAGREMWWYICTGPKGPYCTLFIDHHGIEFRMWAWQTWKTGVQGLLIWQSNYWTSDAAFPEPQLQNPWRDPMSYVSGYSTPAGTKIHWGNGDGRFIYPPANYDATTAPIIQGPVDSIRWEMLRDGIEDYEYFWLLRDRIEKAKKAGRNDEAVARAESLLNIPDSITRDHTHFTKDPLEIYKYREQLAAAILEMR